MPVYSYSRINTYDHCPMQYKFKYLDRIKPPTELKTIEAFMGNCIHHVLKDFYQQLLFQRIPSLEEVLALYQEEWKKNWTDDIVIMKMPLEPGHYRQTGEKALKSYYERYHPFSEDQSLSLEKELTFPIGPYSFKGYIDRLSLEADDIYVIHDYKTSGSMPTFPEVEKDLQLAMYQISIHRHFPNASKVRSVWHYLLFNQAWTVELEPSQLENKENLIMQKVYTIENDSLFEPQPSALCHWCSYEEICPAKTHALSLEEEELPEEEQGFRMVNAYGKVCADYKKARAVLEGIKLEKEALEKQMVDYAKAHQYKVIQGKTAALQLSDKLSYKFPDSKDPARPFMEKLLEEQNLWKEASILHSARLNKLVKDPQLDLAIRQELMSYTSMDLKTSFKWIKNAMNTEDSEEDDTDTEASDS